MREPSDEAGQQTGQVNGRELFATDMNLGPVVNDRLDDDFGASLRRQAIVDGIGPAVVALLRADRGPADAGSNVARHDHRHAYATAVQLGPERIEPPANRELRGVVRGALRSGHIAGNAADDHDVSATAFEHARCHELGQGDGDHEVQLHEPADLVHAGFEGRGSLRATGVVDQDVDGPKRFAGTLVQVGQGFGVHQVRHDGGDVFGSELCNEGLQQRGPTCGDHHPRTELDQRRHQSATDAIRSSRHPDDCIAKFHGFQMPHRLRFVNATVQQWRVHIEVLGEDEWERLRAVRLASLLDVPEAFGSKHEDVAQWLEPAWRKQLRQITTFIAVEAGRDIGIVRGIEHADLPDAAYLVSMWVDPDARGEGVGGALIERVVEWTAASGRTRLFLDVRTSNPAAERLYRARGFVPTGERMQVEEFTELQFVREWVSGFTSDS